MGAEAKGRELAMAGMRKLRIPLIGCLGILHVLIVGFLPHPLLWSNLVQLFAPILAITLCGNEVRITTQPYFRRLWLLVATSFLINAAAQGGYVWFVFKGKHQPPFPNLMDFLWLAFSVPFLLAASRSQEFRESVDLIDCLQGCTSVAILFAIFCVHPGGLTDSFVFGIQSAGLLCASILRYSTAASATERTFFRNLVLFALSNGVLSTAGLIAQDYGAPVGGFSDLAWSLPILIFSAAIALSPNEEAARSENSTRWMLPSHICGLASLGIALTSMAAAVMLTRYSAVWGLPALSVSMLLFAWRTAIRESQLTRAQQALRHSAFHDPLTGLANRALLLGELSALKPVDTLHRALLFLDLDGFKALNDTHGHAFGDSFLIHVAQLLRSAVRPEDLVTRLGGDEFVILFKHIQTAQFAERVARRVLETLESTHQWEDRAIRVTGSIGLLAFGTGNGINNLLDQADAAMYEAKRMGKNRLYCAACI